MPSKIMSANIIAKARMNAILINAKKLLCDPDKSSRLSAQLCKCCHYIASSKVVFQAFTNTNCLECKIEMTSPTSSVDCYCLTCAQNESVCKHCGADMDVDALSGNYDALRPSKRDGTHGK